MQPVLESGDPACLRVVDPAGVDHRDAHEPPGEAAHDIGADAAVQVDEVGAYPADQAGEPRDHQQVGVPVHGQIVDFCDPGRRGGQVAAARTGEPVLVSARGEPAQQVEDLKGPAVEMAASFDVQDPHGATPMSARAVASTSPTPMSRIH